VKAITFVKRPEGTKIRMHTVARPKVGEVFDIHHAVTQEVVERARVTSIEKQGRTYKVVGRIVP
jgi:hypothetical protein